MYGYWNDEMSRAGALLGVLAACAIILLVSMT